LFLDSILIKTGVIAYFFDELMSSWTAWLGCLLVGSIIIIEKAFINMVTMLRKIKKENTYKN